MHKCDTKKKKRKRKKKENGGQTLIHAATHISKKLTKHVCQLEKSSLQAAIFPGFWLFSTSLISNIP